MLWQLPASVRSLAAISAPPCWAQTCRRYSVGGAPREPLSILFCGSDAFSIKSLDAINEAREAVPGLIRSIDVVHRRAKFTGRRLKTLREVPIHDFATSLNLPTHSIDTFTNWHPPSPISLVIAVSFGLLIPPRILSLSQHGGINLHPSLLPDLRGPSPVEHAILRGRKRTGVSIQTLHPTEFDRGMVLAQTPAPGMEIAEDMTAGELEAELAIKGADMLVGVLKKGTYMTSSENENAGTWYTGPISHAPKITKQDRYVSFAEHDLEQILAIQRALGDMWCVLPNGERLIMHRVASVEDNGNMVVEKQEPGLWAQQGSACLLFKAKCGRIGQVVESTYAGGKKGQGNAKVVRMLSEAARWQPM